MHMYKTGCTVLIVLQTISNKINRKDFVLFKDGSNKGRLIFERNKPVKEALCVVVMCTRTGTIPLSPQALLKELNHFGLYGILLRNVAAHPQFSGSKLAPFAEQFVPSITKRVGVEIGMEEEFRALKQSAHKEGFSLKNPSLLLIKHIFMDSISNQIELHQDTKNDIGVRETVNR